MRHWLTAWAFLAASLAAVGCGGGGTAGVSITLSQTTATVPLGGQVQFVPTVTGSTNTVEWSLNGMAVATSTTPSGTTTLGTVDVNGIYTAPNALPATGTTITVTATVQSTSATASATITVNSGVIVTVTPTTYTIGTGEQFQFAATVSGIASNTSLTGVCVPFATGTPASSLPPCNAVTWTVTGTNPGTINATTGNYLAPSAATTASITATSVFDINKATTVSVTVSAAADPTITSVSPRTAAVGTPFQDIYITGTNFISTTVVYVDGTAIGTSQGQGVSLSLPTALRIRLPDTALSAGVHTVTVSQQNGSPQSCMAPALPTQCQLTLSAVRPAIVGAPSVPQQSLGGSLDFNLDGGYFGSAGNPAVTVKVGGQPETLTIHDGISAANRDRQLTVHANASQMTVPGLYPVELDSATPGIPPAIVNVAVQPTSPSPSPLATLAVGTAPAAVAINTATGIAVVANEISNDVTLVDMTQSPPRVLGFLCTGTTGLSLSATETNACPTAGPLAVAVDNVRNLAIVGNCGTPSLNAGVPRCVVGSTTSLAVINLASRSVTAVVGTPTVNPGTSSPATLVPAAVAASSVTGLAVVAYQSSNVASILDLTQTPTAPQSQSVVSSTFFKGVVTVSNGLYPHAAVSPKLNWALVTPGAVPGAVAGSLSVVDLGRQSVNVIAANGATRAGGTVTITTTATQGLQVGQPVLIQGVVNPQSPSDASFDGYYTVVSVTSSTTFTYTQASTLPNVTSGYGGGTASYASPVTSVGLSSLTVQGVAINDQTQQAVIVDPLGGVPAQVVNLFDQTTNAVTLPTTEQSNTVAAAFSPLADFAITVNNITGAATLINPVSLSQLSANPTFSVGSRPVDVAIDPVTNDAIFVNQGDNTATIFSLGDILSQHHPTPTPQILDVSAQPTVPGSAPLPGPSVVEGAAVIVGSTLTSGVNALNSPPVVTQTLTVTGGIFNSNSRIRLDGVALPAATTVLVSPRQLTAQVPASMQLVPRRYAVDVLATDTGAVSNASSFTVIQSVSLAMNTCSAPQPQGVAIDDTNNLVVVTEPGCTPGIVSIVDLATGTALNSQAAVAVGTDPLGVGVLPSAGLAVIANFGSNSASIVDEINGTGVVATATTDSSPAGVTVDRGSGNALVVSFGANLLDVFPVGASPGTPSTNTVGQGPVAVAVDSSTHLAAVSNSTSGSVSLVDLTGATSTATLGGLSLPKGVDLDPCNTTSAQTGNCLSSGFLVAESGADLVDSITPATLVGNGIRVGVDPSSLAYNFNSSTLVTANSQSQTMSVVDFIDHTVRAVLSLMPSSLFGVAIHPQTNLAVVADTTNNQLLLIPLPR